MVLYAFCLCVQCSYCCLIISSLITFSGPEVATYEEIKRQIREFLFSQIEEDKGIAACLIIQTCNKNKEKVMSMH